MADSPHAQSLKSRAKLLAARGELREALEAYEAALRVDPDDPVSHLRVAEMYQSLEHEAAAISAYLNAARAWTRAGELLRAVAALVMARVPGTRFDVVHTVAERFALPPGALAPTFAWVPDGKDPGVPVLASVGREAFVALVEALEVRAFWPGQRVVEEGQPGDSMFALVEGSAEVARRGEGNARQVVATLGPGDFFGEVALVSEGPRLASVEVRERSVLLEFKRQSLARVSAAHPEVDAAVHAFYQRRLVENLLRTSPLFTNLPPALKQAMSREFDLRAVPAGEVLLTQGQPGDAFYLLLRGQVQLSLEQRGRIVLLPELREGDVFGEISLLLDKPVSATVRTRTPCVVLRLERAAFERHVVTQPGLKGQLMRMGTERLQQTAKALFV
ncbi:tetratricopeptide repeat protein [Corallococcus interemptor]|uniref:Tetratricopeptide repeat protein n=1 Tax=Corallococcus interemptor TaxID=2316720 RepID=A0A3A8Q8R2_9BACT|nr:cyclic nucleotide-binding domain-containing protein [Corallococcus interemptor]RKH39496.1 tetratricopeptide repeat protein [Corallococcus sp. AB050B]RKH61142.1 tetratricopeptide repeat protein [Corallococcus interemptor]